MTKDSPQMEINRRNACFHYTKYSASSVNFLIICCWDEKRNSARKINKQMYRFESVWRRTKSPKTQHIIKEINNQSKTLWRLLACRKIFTNFIMRTAYVRKESEGKTSCWCLVKRPYNWARKCHLQFHFSLRRSEIYEHRGILSNVSG